MANYGPRKTLLTGHELTVTDEMKAQAFWLVRKYSSLTYIGRMYQLFAEFLRGYEDVARKQNDRNAWYRENLADLYKYQASFEKGLDLLGQGYRAGYDKILEGLFFGDFLLSPRFEYGREHRSIGYRIPPQPHEALYAWVDVAIVMSGKVQFTLDAQWAFPRILEPEFGPFVFPPKLDLLPQPIGPRIDPDSEVVASGVWLPLDIPNGCPNYLVAGKAAPAGTRLSKQIDYPDYPGGDGEEPEPAHTEYAYDEQPTRWALLWEDHRYEGGKIPDESAYLDPSTAPPPWPPAA
jgi:hypothetical protein